MLIEVLAVGDIIMNKTEGSPGLREHSDKRQDIVREHALGSGQKITSAKNQHAGGPGK